MVFFGPVLDAGDTEIGEIKFIFSWSLHSKGQKDIKLKQIRCSQIVTNA